MRRRRKSLAGTPSEHDARREGILDELAVLQKAAREGIVLGTCHQAQVNLIGAARKWGAYQTEKAWAQSSSRRLQGKERPLGDEFNRLGRSFVERCIIVRTR